MDRAQYHARALVLSGASPQMKREAGETPALPPQL
jgi:hypothetical protein